MNFLSLFEERIGSIFGDSSKGFTAPFSFKKLARQASREMEAETFVIDGIDTAPALYTVLVSAADDAAMRPLYDRLTTEVAQLIQAEATTKGYTFVGQPLVRFMVDPGLRSGKFTVFAENVDARSLARLRAEEEAFLAGGLGMGGAASNTGESEPLEELPAQAAAPELDLENVPQVASFDETPGYDIADVPELMDDPDLDGLDVIPVDSYEQAMAEAASYAGPQTVLRKPAAAAPSADEDDELDEEGESIPVPTRPTTPAQALLIDHQSGRTYTVTAPSAIVGRERTRGGVVLRDPNVSRRHAEISYEDGVWRIADLGSTNGTLVNDVDIDSCSLRDGDLLTLGLVNLEFREN